MADILTPVPAPVLVPRRDQYVPLAVGYHQDPRVIAAGPLGELLWLRLLALPAEELSYTDSARPCVLEARARWYAHELLGKGNAGRLVRRTVAAGLLVETWTEEYVAAVMVARDGLALPAAVAEGETIRRAPIDPVLRVEVYARDGFACLACGSTTDLTLDHIHPWSLGGPDTFDNLQTLCRPCNSRKGARV